MSHIFISYARSTEAQARLIEERLRALAYEVWRDDELPAHRPYADVIDDRLAAAKAVLVIWSADAARSDWVQSEADQARVDQKLIQLTVDGARLPRPFDRIHCAMLQGWTGDTSAPGWRKVLESIAELAGPPGVADATNDAVGGTDATRWTPAGARVNNPLLAVLPFDNLSSDRELAYFSDGLSEDIQLAIARTGSIRVVARSSSFQFRGSDKDIGQVTALLKTTHVLDGSVRRSGNKLRVSAQLCDCLTQTICWSCNYHGELGDIFALQDQIAAEVLRAIAGVLVPTGSTPRIDTNAYEYFLKAREASSRDGDASLESIRLLELAVQLAPQFARAWAQLAAARVLLLRFSPAPMSGDARTSLRSSAIAAAEIALGIDPHEGAAYAALSLLQPIGAYAQREDLILRGLRVAPGDATAHGFMSHLLSEVGRLADAVEHARMAHELDPGAPAAANWYATLVGFKGDHALSQSLFDAFMARWPDMPSFRSNARAAAASREDWKRFDALATAAAPTDSPHSAMDGWNQAYAAALRGNNPGFAPALLAHIDELRRTHQHVSAGLLVCAAELGCGDDIFSMIDGLNFDQLLDVDALSASEAAPQAVIFSAHLNARWMHDRRFVALCASLRLCDYWTATGYWPDCASLDTLPYQFQAECRRMLDQRI